ncbi:uncharacterized protein [Ranitomeya imitator]|uniref:uncharacterized protein n=1 Tax=Ranitomeya imitator TaxID=111125 RepID=UPI0037E7A20B
MRLLGSNKEIEKDREGHSIGVFGDTPLLNSGRAVEPTTRYMASLLPTRTNSRNIPGCLETFQDLLGRVQGAIRRQGTQLHRAIPAEERLLVTARFLATREILSSLHFQYRLGISTLSGIVLRDEFILLPTAYMWMEIADKFWSVCKFPNCLGAVDGKHIRITKPARSGSEHFNYKKYFSVVLMAIADADCRFIAMDIGAFGRGNNSQTFKNSDMGLRVYGKTFHFPLPQPLPNTQDPPMPFVMVGDEAFQMCENLLKPYFSRNLNHTKRIYNYRLTRARRTVECTFWDSCLKMAHSWDSH